MLRLIDSQARFVVVHKPAGVHVHAQDGTSGLVEELGEQLGERVYLVHRLDTPTSGLMVFARDQATAGELGKAFAERQIEKRYLAISDRKPKKKQGWVRGGMAKARRGAWKLTRGDENLAQTQFVSESLAPGLRAYLLRPRTGRTHQLRVALKSVGAPILGDVLYGGSESDRCYLHAAGLSFELAGQRHGYWHVPDVGEAFCTPEFSAAAEAWRGDGDPWS